MDIWTKEKRSRVMSNIRGKDTKPEIVLRSALFRRGYRFRIHQKNLLGKPDIVIKNVEKVESHLPIQSIGKKSLKKIESVINLLSQN